MKAKEKSANDHIKEFEIWWEEEGKVLLPVHYHDNFDHVKRMCGHTWLIAAMKCTKSKELENKLLG